MILNLTHTDLDGVSCGLLLKKFYKDNIETLFVNYNNIDEVLKNNYHQYESIIFSDVTPSESALSSIKNVHITIIDHHRTSEKLRKYADTWKHDIDYSGTYLVLQYLENDCGFDLSEYHEFVECVNDFDLWHHKRAESSKLNNLFYMIGIERFFNRFLNNPSIKFTEIEQFVIDIKEEDVERYIKATEKNVEFDVDSNGNKFAVLFCEKYISQVGDHYVKNYGVDYIILINAQNKSVSLRSRPGIDISNLAVKNGGGGHKNASGFNTTYDFGLKTFLKIIGI
jgi:hypothetical protein